MDAAERIASDDTVPLTWAEICAQYPDRYVLLVDVENGIDGAIRSGRVLDHDHSMRQLLARIDVMQACSVIIHTSGRALRFPRIEITDEIRNIVRPHR